MKHLAPGPSPEEPGAIAYGCYGYGPGFGKPKPKHTMHDQTFTFSSKLWMYQGKGAWHFLTLPNHAANEIRFFNASAKGFTPLKVTATIGDTTWKTAIFPDSKSASFVLVVKLAVRKAENIKAGDMVTANITLKSAL